MVPKRLSPRARISPPFLSSILGCRIDAYLKACGLLAVCTVVGGRTASAATLLSSAETAVSSFQPAASGLFTPAQGRQGPVAQPSGQSLGSASGVNQAVTQPTYVPSTALERGTSNTGTTETVTRRRRSEPESEGGSHRRRSEPEREETVSHGGATKAHPAAPAPGSEGDFKGQAVATTAKNITNVEFGWGWYNEYYFRGVNILRAVSSERTNSGVFTAHAVGALIRPEDAFTVGFNYWQALGRQQPKGGEFQVPPNSDQKSGRKFALPSRDRYAEYNINLAYTRTLIDKQLVGTVGFNRYNFSNGTFYETGTSRAITYADESVVKLAYVGQKYFTPSVSWAHDFDGFIGDFFELRVDGNYALPSKGSITASIRPYVSLSYDMDYNGSNNGLNSVEFGADLPIQLTNNLTLTFTGNYVQALEASEGNTRAKTGFWGGVSMSASWGGPKRDLPVGGYDKSSKQVLLSGDASEKKWDVSVGASYQTADFGFSHGQLSMYPVRSQYEEKDRLPFGHIGFATANNNVVYDDGAVLGLVPAASPLGARGVALAIIPGLGTQIIGAPGANGYARFSSSRYSYQDEGHQFSPISDDQDANVSPYVKIDREIFKHDSWSIRAGLGYSFLISKGDSGYSLDRLDTLIERRDRFGFDYPVDNVSFASPFLVAGIPATFSNRQLVVIDPAAYAASLSGGTGNPPVVTAATANYLRTLRPLMEREVTQSEVVAVASFVRSSLDLNSHELALPISLDKDFGNRFHVQLTVAPTLTIADAQLTTEVSQRALAMKDLDQATTNVLMRNVLPQGKITFGGIGGVKVAAQPATAPPPPVAQNQAQPTGGGKGATPQSPNFPGRDVGNRKYDRNQVSALFGFNTQASLIFDLNDDKTIYAELWGGYHWVQELHVSNGFGESSIDLSGFRAGIGLGFRF